MVRVLGIEHCPQCRRLTAYLDSKAIDCKYETVEPEQIQRESGYQSAPVAFIDGEWYDFNTVFSAIRRHVGES